MKKGFTLIELLVVIVIIGILSSLLMANFVGIRQRARDGQRKANLRQIQTALELYRADQGSYPGTDLLPACNTNAFIGGTPPVTYMEKIPCDPLGSTSYIYTPGNNNAIYELVACLENSNDQDKDQTTNSACTTSYTLKNP